MIRAKTRSQRFEKLVKLWYDCKKCPLSETRARIVHGEGDIDSRVLFVAEAPGKNEDQSGKPFTGAAGKKLDELLEVAKLTRKSFFLVNTIACRPSRVDEDTGYVRNRPPSPQELTACSPRLRTVFRIVDPLVLVLLGRVAVDALFPFGAPQKKLKNVRVFSVTHPAAYLYGDKTPDSEYPTWKEIAKTIRSLDKTESSGADWESVVRGQLHSSISVKEK